MIESILQITFNNTIPLYWLIGAIVTAVAGIAQVYGMFKSLIQRVDKLEKKDEQRDEKIDTIATDVSFIKGKIESL